VGKRRTNPWYLLAIAILWPPNRLLMRHEWRHPERVPRTGGVILAVNHISTADPLTFAYFVHEQKRQPRYLAKEEVFELRGWGRIVRGAGQIPVRRGTTDASRALSAARKALEEGKCVIIYPEGTVTKDPDGWPMAARTGAARLALESGAPVLPVAQWGAQDLVGGGLLARLRRRPLLQVSVGEPVDLSPWRGRPLSAEVLRAATSAIMTGINAELEGLRGGTAPAVPFDPRVDARPEPRRSA
jgi:1-acyl-sn-glycerol-3-phosphate acyltransferase